MSDLIFMGYYLTVSFIYCVGLVSTVLLFFVKIFNSKRFVIFFSAIEISLYAGNARMDKAAYI